MLDKIKVNLSFYVYKTILHDMYRFEYFKSNGQINKNDFLNVVIYNFYYGKLKKRETIKNKLIEEGITADIPHKSRDLILNSCSKIMDDFYHEDLYYNYHQYYFTIYPTRYTLEFFLKIYENEVKNKTAFSSFIRKLLNEYAYLPQYIRENIAKKREFIELSEACQTSNIIIFNTSNTEQKVAPYRLITNIEETFTYREFDRI